MRFMLTYKMKPELREAAIKRFRKTGGAPPDGITLLGRWHCSASLRGWTLIESKDPKTLADFAFAWSDLMTLEAHPVVEDGELSAVFETAGY